MSCLLSSLLEDLDQVLVLGIEGGEVGVSNSTLLGWGGTGRGGGVSRMTLLGRGGADPDGGAAGDDAGVGAAGGGAGVSRWYLRAGSVTASSIKLLILGVVVLGVGAGGGGGEVLVEGAGVEGSPWKGMVRSTSSAQDPMFSNFFHLATFLFLSS